MDFCQSLFLDAPVGQSTTLKGSGIRYDFRRFPSERQKCIRRHLTFAFLLTFFPLQALYSTTVPIFLRVAEETPLPVANVIYPPQLPTVLTLIPEHEGGLGVSAMTASTTASLLVR